MKQVRKQHGIRSLDRTVRSTGLVICLAFLVGASFCALAQDELKPFSTKDLEAHLRKTEKELKTLKNLEGKLESASRQSSNSSRRKVIEGIQEHMGACILRREDDLGQEHTIRQHGEPVSGGTTGAAEVGAPVGSSNTTNPLMYKEGLAGMRLRQLARLQAIFVAARQINQSAVERQGDALERYLDQTRRFREELERAVGFINDELDRRRWEREAGRAE
jgi:hypothetical protein